MRCGFLTFETVDRTHIDNGATVGNVSQLRPQAVHASREICRDDPVPFLVLKIHDIGLPVDVVLVDAGNVGGAVEAAKLLDDAADPGIDLLPDGNVDVCNGERDAFLLEERLSASDGLGIPVGDADGSPTFGDCLGRGKPNAAGAAGDGNDLAGERHG